MRIKVLMLTLLGMCDFSTVANASSPISPRVAESVARAIVRDYQSGGMSRLQIVDDECYSAARSRDSAGKCVLYDIAAHHIDVTFRQEMNLDSGPSKDYFSDDELGKRVLSFINLYLAGSKYSFEVYFDHIPKKIDQRVALLMSK